MRKQPIGMSRESSYKVGEAVTGKKAIISSKDGKEVTGRVIYKRKAEYRDDPFRKRA
ncbi:hypothetical protein ACFFHF_13510 [Robertmurraya beringensis]|uniref:Uncharacterized protein n=1 Tax=Robertmurraya beringensis TaxID=641660 RepID=A0ABV6KWD7_9BACI